MDKNLLDIVCCPVDRTPLRLLQRSELADLNRAIEGGKLTNHAGEPVQTALQRGLVTTDGKTVYPVQDDIPVLLADAGIAMAQLESSA